MPPASRPIVVFGTTAIAAVLCLMCGCSGAAPKPTIGPENAISVGIRNVQRHIGRLADFIDKTATLSVVQGPHHSASFLPLAAPRFESNWTQQLILDPVAGSTAISPRNWIDLQLQPDTRSTSLNAINGMGRMLDSLQILCAINVMLQSARVTLTGIGYPEVGSRNIAISSDLKTAFFNNCGTSLPSIIVGTSVQVAVQSASRNTFYDLQLIFADLDTVYYLKKDVRILNILMAQNLPSGAHVRMALAWDVSGRIFRAEYIAVPSAAGNPALTPVVVDRLYWNEANDVSYLHSFSGVGNASIANGDKFVLGVRPQNGDAYSLSFRSPSVGSDSKYEACVGLTSKSIVIDGARCFPSSLRLAGFDVDAALVDTGIASNVYSNRNSVWDWKDATQGVDGSETVGFAGVIDFLSGPYDK